MKARFSLPNGATAYIDSKVAVYIWAVYYTLSKRGEGCAITVGIDRIVIESVYAPLYGATYVVIDTTENKITLNLSEQESPTIPFEGMVTPSNVGEFLAHAKALADRWELM